MIQFLTPAALKRYRGKTCLLRVDLNVEPGAENFTNRVDDIIPTIRMLLKQNVRVVLLSHRGRPALKPEWKLKGLKSDWNFNTANRALSLRPLTRILQKKLKTQVHFIPYEHSWLLEPKEFLVERKEKVFLLENLRFYRGEETNDNRFGEFLADWGDFFVNDAFAVSHRKNASVVAITKFLPSYGGLCLKTEIQNLSAIQRYHIHPFVMVVGGAKVGDKLRLLRGIVKKADAVLLGSSVFNEHNTPAFRALRFPDDIKVGGNFAWDIGPHTIINYSKQVGGAKMVVWNGPLGFYEKKGFDAGTRALWHAVFANKKAHIVIGGGETVASLRQLKIKNSKLKIGRNVFISTGGGAMLAYLAGEKLPGIEALK